MTFPILYCRTSKGQVQTWQITHEKNTFFTAEGIKGGVITVSKPTVCEGKNIGRANETTPEQQAYAEAKAKWQKKLDSGYHEDESKIDEAKFFEPMTAHKWEDYKEDTKYPFFSQPKLDGMRCVVDSKSMMSRGGKPIKSAPHILELLQVVFKEYPNAVIDGELYNHEYKHNFNKIISLAKKAKPTAEDLKESADKLQYWVYDIFFPDKPDMPFSDRIARLKTAVSQYFGPKHKSIRYVKTFFVRDEKDLEEEYQSYIDEGYEGQMIRVERSKYENKRTKSLLKRKDFIDEEFELVNLEEGKGNRAGLATRATLKTKNDTIFEAGVIGNEEYAAQILKDVDKLRGKPATVVYFNLTPDGVPRFGKLKIIRDYE